MRFIDEAQIKILAGHGGAGAISFRRETFVPRGGPDGGDGGRGGDVIFVADENLTTLQDLRFKRIYQAQAGEHGMATNCAGKDGLATILRVPIGTIIKNAETGETLYDFSEDKQSWIACQGGRGGKGNAHFTTSTFQTPKFAQPGEPGTELEVKLELKLLADVGIIGYPNVGKSTLISKISAARPKVADYPFTTLTPNLGVVSVADFQSYVVADIPGLIEGAHRGEGLGTKFLKHVERCSLFLHVLDATHILSYDTVEEAVDGMMYNYTSIRKELELFEKTLCDKPEIIVINKTDLFREEPAMLEQASELFRKKLMKVRNGPILKDEPILISGVDGVGLEKLKMLVFNEVQFIKKNSGKAEKRILMPDEMIDRESAKSRKIKKRGN